ncbi:maleylpyruvate isomerase N-terminal domain-containing protein [bacterium]|nr:maleylpyruvate isomerase N-terminal domain-containing protein [bacterium]
MSEDDPRSLSEERRFLVGRLNLEFNQLVRNIETCRIRDIDRPFIGEWSLKDIVGHVATWEAEVLKALRELREGQRPELLDFDEAKINEWNEDRRQRKAELGFQSVYEQLKGGHQRLVDEIDLASDEDIATEGSVYNVLVQSTIDHTVEHWHEIAAKLAGMEGVRPTGPVSVPEETASR